MILVPVDGSTASAHALAYACDFGKLLGTQVHVCYAVDHVRPEAPAKSGDAILANAREIARTHDVTVQCHLLRGHAAAEILRLSDESRADLLIMGTHGRTGVRRLILGRVAEQVMRRSHVPVVLLRDPTDDESPVTTRKDGHESH